MSSPDPMEEVIAEALKDAGIVFTREDRHKGRAQMPDDIVLDFHLVDYDIYIEVKQFHTDRIAKQMASADNVIVAQGRAAVEMLATLIRSGCLPQK